MKNILYISSVLCAFLVPLSSFAQEANKQAPNTQGVQISQKINRIEPKPFSQLTSEELKIIENAKIKIRFGNHTDKLAIAIKKQLEKLGASICNFEPSSGTPDGIRPFVVYYEGGNNLTTAMALQKLLEKNGFNDWSAADNAGSGCYFFMYIL